MRRSLVYFLKPSYWSKHSKHYVEVSSVYDAEVNGALGGDVSIEPISPEFRGKEAIRYDLQLGYRLCGVGLYLIHFCLCFRINNIRKVYKEKDSVVEALRGQ